MSIEMTDEKLIKVMDKTKGFESTKAFTTFFLKEQEMQISSGSIIPRELREKINEEGENPSLNTVKRYFELPTLSFDLRQLKDLWEKIDSGLIVSEEMMVIAMGGEKLPLSVIFDDFVRMLTSIDINKHVSH